MTKSWTQKLGWLVLLVSFGAVSVASAQNGADKAVVWLIADGNNAVVKLEWTEDLTFARALMQRPIGDYRLVAEVWRPDSRVIYKGAALREAESMAMKPNDVVVIGVVDEGRRKIIEALPEIAALKLPVLPRERSLPAASGAVPAQPASRPAVSQDAQAGHASSESSREGDSGNGKATADVTSPSFRAILAVLVCLAAVGMAMAVFWRLKRGRRMP